MIFGRKNQCCAPFLAAAFTALFLVACSTESDFATSPSQATAKPTAKPIPTTVPYEEFASATISPADPARLAKLTKLMSLIPNSYGSSIYLDMESVRSNDALTALISPEALGMDVAFPSIAISLLNTVAVAVDFKTLDIVTPFQADFAIEDILELAASFGLDLNAGDSTPYESHDVWDIDVLGAILSMASADETMGVATSGQGITTRGARALAERSLDAFDGRSAQMLDASGLLELLGGVPSGFVAGVLSDCKKCRCSEMSTICLAASVS